MLPFFGQNNLYDPTVEIPHVQRAIRPGAKRGLADIYQP
jgi:hypothetical protein